MRATTSPLAVPGILIGHAETPSGRSGTTVVLCPAGAVGAVDVRGGAPGTRETDLLAPAATVQRIHAVTLSGGSAFGLAACDGVMEHLAQLGVGHAVGAFRVPIVCGAILFDLPWLPPGEHPTHETGLRAARAARPTAPEGSVGAGAGCSVGKLRGHAHAVKAGIGMASRRVAQGCVLTAVVAVNALGDVVADDGALLAGPRGRGGAMRRTLEAWAERSGDAPPSNTTIGVVAVSARLDKAQATLVARMAQDGLARAIQPVHTAHDGDTVFVLASDGPAVDPSLLGAHAAEVMAQAIRRSIFCARGFDGLPAATDLPSPN